MVATENTLDVAGSTSSRFLYSFTTSNPDVSNLNFVQAAAALHALSACCHKIVFRHAISGVRNRDGEVSLIGFPKMYWFAKDFI